MYPNPMNSSSEFFKYTTMWLWQDISNKSYLFWTVGNYVIAYRITVGKELMVVRVLHSARNFRRLFQGSSWS